ncbi:MAG: hypothetical protein KAR35_08300, partial [Candidatus Heimdallarchaeota archaeon]|nr:hypothetical protein [Candidatus Heimdallarchaeota archaeon]MCK5049359.1 hypothetical protein [Candidatus Heimdallarchaeota archaeon]
MHFSIKPTRRRINQFNGFIILAIVIFGFSIAPAQQISGQTSSMLNQKELSQLPGMEIPSDETGQVLWDYLESDEYQEAFTLKNEPSQIESRFIDYGAIRDVDDGHRYSPLYESVTPQIDDDTEGREIQITHVIETGIEKELIDEYDEQITYDYESISGKIPVTHSFTENASGIAYTSRTDYPLALDTSTDLRTMLSGKPYQMQHNGHFTLIVFVADYRSQSLSKLSENHVWRVTYSLLEDWASETSDCYAMLTNEYATPQNIVNYLATAQKSERINSISVAIVSHGVNDIFGHGILIHRDDNPYKLGVMDGTIFNAALKKTGVGSIFKLQTTMIHACYIMDEFREYGKDSVIGFFQKQNPMRTIIGYSGLVFLNTDFVLSLENILASGRYELPTKIKRMPMTIYDPLTKRMQEVTYYEKSYYISEIVGSEKPKNYAQRFNQQESLWIYDIKSPKTGDSHFYDFSVYEHLGTTPPSAFPYVGASANIEGHRVNSWTTL